jgi:CheY-like chemotaxis protein
MKQKIKVLIVDDEKQFRATTKKVLDRRGFETIVAGSGEEAIQKLKEAPDVVVLDVKMPGMDGHQALKEIKKRNSDLPVIMLTGHGAMPSAREALVEGAFDYLAKPCDIDLLSAKITEASAHGRKGLIPEEKSVFDVMVPLEEYTILSGEQTIKEAIEALWRSFTSKFTTSRIMETGHRSILVIDERQRVQGILAITDLLSAIMPRYLSAPKPAMADSIQYSPMFWKGMFRREVKMLGTKKIKDVMSPAPLSVEAGDNLMTAAYTMQMNNARRMAVMKEGQVVGVIREQDLFFEMERILRE